MNGIVLCILIMCLTHETALMCQMGNPNKVCTTVNGSRGFFNHFAYYGKDLHIVLPSDAFSSDGLYQIEVKVPSWNRLPKWLKFSQKKCSLLGIVPRTNITHISLAVTASCPTCFTTLCKSSYTFTIFFREFQKDFKTDPTYKPVSGRHKKIYFNIIAGLYSEFDISKDFFDSKYATATPLHLSLSFKNGSLIPKHFWLSFDQELLKFSAFPTIYDFHKDPVVLILKASDGGWLDVSLTIIIKMADDFIRRNYSYLISLAVDKRNPEFKTPKSLVRFFSQFSLCTNATVDTKNSIVLDILPHDDVTTIRFSSYSSINKTCVLPNNEALMNIVNQNGSLREYTSNCLKPRYVIRDSKLWIGTKCKPEQSASRVSQIILIVLIIFAVIVFIIIVVCSIVAFITQKKRHSTTFLRHDKIVSSMISRKPVILPDDLQMIDVDYKGQKPMILAGEHGLTSTVNVLQDDDFVRPPPPDYQTSSECKDVSSDDSFGCDQVKRDSTLPVYRPAPPYTFNRSIFTDAN